MEKQVNTCIFFKVTLTSQELLQRNDLIEFSLYCSYILQMKSYGDTYLFSGLRTFRYLCLSYPRYNRM